MDDTDVAPDPAAALVDTQGQTFTRRKAEDKRCPRCRGDKWIASCGFGEPHPLCPRCGFEKHGERFNG